MTKILSGILILVAMTTFNLAPVYADGHKGGGSSCTKCSHGGEKKCKVKKLKKKMAMYWAYKDELKLSDDQLSKIADIKHAAMKQMIQESADVKVIKVDVKTELWAPQIDFDKVSPMIDAKYAAKAKVAKTMVKALADAQAVLSSEQRDQMKEIKTDRYIEKSGIRGGCSGGYCPTGSKS